MYIEVSKSEFEAVKKMRSQQHIRTTLKMSDGCINMVPQDADVVMSMIPDVVNDVYDRYGMHIRTCEFDYMSNYPCDWFISFDTAYDGDCTYLKYQTFDVFKNREYTENPILLVLNRIDDIRSWISTLEGELHALRYDGVPRRKCSSYGDMDIEDAYRSYMSDVAEFDAAVNIFNRAISDLKDAVSSGGAE